MDFDAAVKAHKSDDKIDREYEALMRQLMTYMMEDPSLNSTSYECNLVSSCVERIGDRCQNICEYIIYFMLKVKWYVTPRLKTYNHFLNVHFVASC